MFLIVQRFREYRDSPSITRYRSLSSAMADLTERVINADGERWHADVIAFDGDEGFILATYDASGERTYMRPLGITAPAVGLLPERLTSGD